METVYFAKWILLESGDVLLNGAISIDGPLITSIGPRSKIRRTPEQRIVNLGDVIILPGLVNTHIHLEECVVRGIQKNHDETFAAWNAKKNSRIRMADPGQISASIRLTVKELLAQGITSIVDNSRLGLSLPVLKDEPIRSWVINEIHADELSNEKQFFDTCAFRMNRYQDHTGHGLAPYSLYSVSPEMQKQIIKYCTEQNLIWSTHVAESAEELQAFSEKKGDLYFYTTRKREWPFGGPTAGPVNYAISNDLIPTGGICVHCNYVNGQELSYLKDKEVSVVICHSYTHELGHRMLPLDVALNRNCNLCLGTEGIAPQGFLSLFDELFSLKQAFPHIPAKEMLKWVTINPCKALRVDNKLGSLSEGKLADLIAVRFAYSSDEDILEELLIEEPEIALVIVNGEEIIFNC